MRLVFYRRFAGLLFWLFERVTGRARRQVLGLGTCEKARHGKKRIWIHAASAGELESLWTIAKSLVQLDYDLVLSCFSPSCDSRLKILALELELLRPGSVLDYGRSPREGQWRSAIQFISPDLFVTAKYEAWPDLWASLSQNKIGLVIIAARLRSSLRVVRCVLRILGSKVPAVTLLSETQSETLLLRHSFPEFQVLQCSEPRWDRVWDRSLVPHPRAMLLLEALQGVPKPWGVMGSAWEADIEAAMEFFSQFPRGLIWVVPHRVHPAEIQEMTRQLTQMGLGMQLSSQILSTQALQGATPDVILVDELGILAELYRACDWAWVGGGFGAGVHSTIEPALYGVPILCGSSGTKKFSEIPQLQLTGQLTVVRDLQEILPWFKTSLLVSEGVRLSWKQDALKRRGGTATAVAQIVSQLGT